MTETEFLSLQERFAPRGVCFGCGPANQLGLRLRSFVDGDRLTAVWTPASHHIAWPGILNGGIIGTLLDCHCNWTAAYALLQRNGSEQLPSTVTAEYTVRFIQPTPSDLPIELVGEVVRLGTRSAVTHGVIRVSGVVTAECDATFVAVAEGHPAFGRWQGD